MHVEGIILVVHDTLVPYKKLGYVLMELINGRTNDFCLLK